MPSRCDPTPISLAGGVLLVAGAFNFIRHLEPISMPSDAGFGSSCASVAAHLRVSYEVAGSFDVVPMQLAFKFKVE